MTPVLSTSHNGSRKLVLEDILDLRAYEKVRVAEKARVLELKRKRRVELGTILTVLFENRDTMWIQIQEMLRAEKVLTDEGVYEELNAYNPLIPEPGQLSCTVFIEITTEAAMREWLPKLVGIERSIILVLSDGTEVHPVTDAQHDAALTREDITAAVHYIHFNFTPEQVATFAGGPVQLRCIHPNYLEVIELADSTVGELLLDLQANS